MVGNTSGEKRIHWQTHIENWKVSGVSQKSYCVKHNLKLHQFGYWYRQFKHDEQPGVDTARKRTPAASTAFVPVHAQALGSTLPSLSLEFPNGIRIHGIAQLPLAELNALVKALT